ncbi:MAG: protein kinase [Gemmatimonadota bacterium]|nr:MAG: protein kinase [Gemmatimonadota bacterium]
MADLLERLKTALADRYRIERELGSGGMATVYLAHDLRHERPVAVKVLRPELAAALGPERFHQEIKIAANLTHPHILPLHDSGDADGFLYYVMPYIEGESLRDRLQREKQLAISEALQVAREVADALSYAHSHGVIHRDVKPENILLESGHAAVADFGIARAVDAAGGERLTESGITIGTPAYMSPEQAGGDEDLDGRSDLYSLGCVLYEMLAGQPPFTGPTVESLVHQHLSAKPPSVTAIRPSVPGWVAAALERSLAKTAADRFNPVALFAEAITPRTSVTADSERAASPQRDQPRPTRGRRALLGIGGVIAIAAAVVVGRSMWPSTTGSSPPPAAIAVLPFENLSAERTHAYFAPGLHDELLTQLAKVATLKVISRTSVLTYEGTDKQLREIGEELEVGSIVVGSVQAVGERLRVNVQLIDAETDQHLWAERYDRTLDDAFEVQSELAQQVVAAVGAALTDVEASAIAEAPTQNAEAYRLYLQAEEYRKRPVPTLQNLESSVQLYERALELDPEFASAHAALSIVHGSMWWLRYDSSPERLARLWEAAEAARQHDPDLPQAHWAMGMAHYVAERDFARALEELTIALDGLPGSVDLWKYSGYAHRRLGNWEQALAAFEKATALAPRDAELFSDLGGLTLHVLHRYAEATSAYNRALELAPDYSEARFQRAWLHVLWQGELETLHNVLEPAAIELGAWGPRDLFRARLALWEREPDTLLALLGAAERVKFEGRSWYEPGLLYAAWAHQLRGDRVAAAEAFSGALSQLDSALSENPEDWRLHGSRGLALAGLGRASEAEQEAGWLMRSTEYRDAFDRPRLSEWRAMIFAQAGLTDETLAELEPLLAGPSLTSAHMVRLDPRYDPIRDDPRFEALLDKYVN